MMIMVADDAQNCDRDDDDATMMNKGCKPVAEVESQGGRAGPKAGPTCWPFKLKLKAKSNFHEDWHK